VRTDLNFTEKKGQSIPSIGFLVSFPIKDKLVYDQPDIGPSSIIELLGIALQGGIILAACR
jgi:hypothetical protein